MEKDDEKTSESQDRPRYPKLSQKDLAEFRSALEDIVGHNNPNVVFHENHLEDDFQEDKEKEKFKKRMLYKEHTEYDSRYLDYWISKAGSLTTRGQDIGSAPKRHWGKSDYEYFTTVQPDNKGALLLVLLDEMYGKDYGDFLLLALIEKAWKGDSEAVMGFRNVLEKHNIPYDVSSW